MKYNKGSKFTTEVSYGPIPANVEITIKSSTITPHGAIEYLVQYGALCTSVHEIDLDDCFKFRWTYDSKFDVLEDIPSRICECGSHSVGIDKHSDYCPLFS